MLDPNARILDISTNYSYVNKENQSFYIFVFFFRHKLRVKTHGKMYRYFNYEGKYKKNAKAAKFVDYTSVTCRFTIPIRLPEIAYVNVIIFNRENNNSITATALKNVTIEDIRQLLDFDKKCYDERMLPTCVPGVSSLDRNDSMTTDDVVVVNVSRDKNDDDSSNTYITGSNDKFL